MTERPRPDVSDGVSRWCRTCKGRKTIREDSFFSNSRPTLQQWFLLMRERRHYFKSEGGFVTSACKARKHFYPSEFKLECCFQPLNVSSIV